LPQPTGVPRRRCIPSRLQAAKALCALSGSQGVEDAEKPSTRGRAAFPCEFPLPLAVSGLLPSGLFLNRFPPLRANLSSTPAAIAAAQASPEKGTGESAGLAFERGKTANGPQTVSVRGRLRHCPVWQGGEGMFWLGNFHGMLSSRPVPPRRCLERPAFLQGLIQATGVPTARAAKLSPSLCSSSSSSPCAPPLSVHPPSLGKWCG